MGSNPIKDQTIIFLWHTDHAREMFHVHLPCLHTVNELNSPYFLIKPIQ